MGDRENIPPKRGPGRPRKAAQDPRPIDERHSDDNSPQSVEKQFLSHFDMKTALNPEAAEDHIDVSVLGPPMKKL